MSGPRRLPFSVSMRQWLTLARGVLLAALLGTASLLAGCGGVDEPPDPPPAQPVLSPPQCAPEDECVTTDSITLAWTVDGAVASFELQWSSAAGRWPAANAVTLDGAARTWTHDGLSPNRTWRYRIRAINAQGRQSNWSRVVSATTLPVPKPAQPELSPPQCAPEDECVTTDSITLAWTVDGAVASFELQWNSAAGRWPAANAVTLDGTGKNLDPRRARPEPDLALSHPRDQRAGPEEQLVAGGERHHPLGAPAGPAGALSPAVRPRGRVRHHRQHHADLDGGRSGRGLRAAMELHGREVARGERRHPPRAGENLDPRRSQTEPDLALPHPRDQRAGPEEQLVAGGERHHPVGAQTGPAGALSPAVRLLRTTASPPTASR